MSFIEFWTSYLEIGTLAGKTPRKGEHYGIRFYNWMMVTKNISDQKIESTNKSSENSIQNTELPTKEIGGRDGPDPTRFGDWEKNGRCIDF